MELQERKEGSAGVAVPFGECLFRGILTRQSISWMGTYLSARVMAISFRFGWQSLSIQMPWGRRLLRWKLRPRMNQTTRSMRIFWVRTRQRFVLQFKRLTNLRYIHLQVRTILRVPSSCLAFGKLLHRKPNLALYFWSSLSVYELSQLPTLPGQSTVTVSETSCRDLHSWLNR